MSEANQGQATVGGDQAVLDLTETAQQAQTAEAEARARVDAERAQAIARGPIQTTTFVELPGGSIVTAEEHQQMVRSGNDLDGAYKGGRR